MKYTHNSSTIRWLMLALLSLTIWSPASADNHVIDLEITSNGPSVVDLEKIPNSVRVRELLINGQTLSNTDPLMIASGFSPSWNMTVAQLTAIAKNTQDYLVKLGYLPTVSLGDQQIIDGIVNLHITFKVLGKITVDNQAGLDELLIAEIFNSLKPHAIINFMELQTIENLFSHIPSLMISYQQTPGDHPNSSNLKITLSSKPRVTTNINFDNLGNQYTGQYQLATTTKIADVKKTGDQLTVQSSYSQGLRYAKLTYWIPVDKISINSSYARTQYYINFNNTELKGSSDLLNVYAYAPWFRTSNFNAIAEMGISYREYRDHQIAFTQKSIESLNIGVNVNYISNSRQSTGNYNFNWYPSRLKLTANQVNYNMATSQSLGPYHKFNLSVNQIYAINQNLAITFNGKAQWASKNLDSNDKMSLSGATGVRAYGDNQASGDQGYVVSFGGEFIIPNENSQYPGSVKVLGFLDTGAVQYSKFPWTNEVNRKKLHGWGVGINWAIDPMTTIGFYRAASLRDSMENAAGKQNQRYWFELSKSF